MKKAGINLIEVKERNRALLLQSVCAAGSITRSELSEGLHLSPMTVTNITSELLQKHIIEEFAPQDPIKSPGRTPMLLRICSTSPVVLGIYISRTCLYGVVCDLSLQLLARAKRPLTPIENEESFLQKLKRQIALSGRFWAWASPPSALSAAMPAASPMSPISSASVR